MENASRLERTLERLDEINARDPRREEVEGENRPRELVYALRMTETLEGFEPEASEALHIAARAQHVARWEIPRSDFPDGAAGYKRWRALLMQHHGKIASEVLRSEGYDEESIEQVSRLIRKQGLKRDPEAQSLEDVACLVFLQFYFDDFADDHEDEKLVGILRKTWRKMSERGHEAALDLELSARARRLVERAVGGR